MRRQWTHQRRAVEVLHKGKTSKWVSRACPLFHLCPLTCTCQTIHFFPIKSEACQRQQLVWVSFAASETFQRPYLTFRVHDDMTDVAGCVSLAVGLGQYISLFSHLESGSYDSVFYSCYTHPFHFWFKKLICPLACKQSFLFVFITFCHIFIYLLSGSLTHLALPSCPSPQSIYISLFAPHLSPCFHSVTPRVTKFKSLSAAHSLILSYSLHPPQPYPFTVRAVPQADTEITV